MSAPKGPQLLAKGEYEYLCDGRSVPVSESWQLSRTERGFAMFSQRAIPILSVVITARSLFSGVNMQRCLLDWSSTASGGAIATAFYSGSPVEGIYRYRSKGAHARSVSVQDVHYFPLLRVFVGGVLHALADKGGNGRVLVPWIQDPSAQARLLEPEISARSVRYLGSPNDEKRDSPLDHFQYCGGQYEQGADYWLRNGLLQEYRWRQGNSNWVVRLKNLVGRWPGAELWPCVRPSVSPSV